MLQRFGKSECLSQRDLLFPKTKEIFSKVFSVTNRFVYELLSLIKRVISSAKRESLTGSPRIVMPLMISSPLIFIAKVSRAIINR